MSAIYIVVKGEKIKLKLFSIVFNLCGTARKERKRESLWCSCLADTNDPKREGERGEKFSLLQFRLKPIIDLEARECFLKITNNSLWSAGLEKRLRNSSRPKRGAPLSQPFTFAQIGIVGGAKDGDLRPRISSKFNHVINIFVKQNYKHFNRRKVVRARAPLRGGDEKKRKRIKTTIIAIAGIETKGFGIISLLNLTPFDARYWWFSYYLTKTSKIVIYLARRNSRRPLREKCSDGLFTRRLALAIIWDDYENCFSLLAVQIPEEKQKQLTIFIRFILYDVVLSSILSS